MKPKHHLIALSILVIAMAFLFGAIYKLTGLDIVSFDTGGNSNITIGSDILFEPTTPPTLTCSAQGGQICTSGQTCSGNFVSASDTSFCCIGTCISQIIPPPPPGGGGIIPTSNISVIPGQFILNMLINTNLYKTITITNIGTSSMTIPISQTNLTNLVILGNTSMTLSAGQTAILNVIFVAPNVTGIYNGTISIGDRVVSVSLNVVKEFVLFDSNIIVLNKNYRVPQRDPLKTQVTMIPIGENVRMDVTLNYAIKNVNGTTYTTRSETLLVTSRQSILRDFETGNLPLGNYTINLELVYPFGVAPSSAHFEVVKNVRDIYGTIIYWLVVAIVIIAILIILTIIIRTIRKLRKERTEAIKENEQMV